ncbi:hypothetical protein GCM10008931_15570 [Oceanobacillus oncorhynchi subsp. oncorhynchi]
MNEQCQDDDGFLTFTREEALADVRPFFMDKYYHSMSVLNFSNEGWERDVKYGWRKTDATFPD